jgi:hypothetical protein
MIHKFIMERGGIAIRLTCLQILGIFLIMLFLTNSHSTVYARSTQNQPDFTLQPVTYDSAHPATRSYFILSAQPGATLLENVRVTNVGATAGSVNIYPVSATTAQASGITYLSQNDPLRDVAAWIGIKQHQLTLAPGQSQVIQLQIAVPGSAYPGQHMGGIGAQSVTPSTASGKGTLRITVLTRTIIAVQVNVPGVTAERMKITGIKAGGSGGYQSLLVGMANTGDTMLNPNGALSIKDSQGRLLQVLPLKLGLILPDTSIDYPVNVQKQALSAGDYQASLTLHYGHGKILNYTSKLTITQDQVSQAFSSGPLQAPTSNSMPLWQIILVALAAIVVLFVIGQKVYTMIIGRRRKQVGNTTQPQDELNNTTLHSHTKKNKVA